MIAMEKKKFISGLKTVAAATFIAAGVFLTDSEKVLKHVPIVPSTSTPKNVIKSKKEKVIEESNSEIDNDYWYYF